MAYENCLDYLRLRGIFPGTVAPFCPVDNLILSVCAYVPWEEAVPTLRDGDWLPFPQAVEALTSHPDWDAVGLNHAQGHPHPGGGGRPQPPVPPLSLGCCEHVQDENTQFAALTYRLPDGTLYLAFRGTDDSLAGWKECFALSYTTVPAQKLAQEYLIQVARRYPGKLRVGGHSKGGNLAVWAAVHAPPLVRRRILQVISNDGPGFGRDLTTTRPTRSWQTGSSPTSPRPPWWAPSSTRTPGPGSSRATGQAPWASTTPSPGRSRGLALSPSPTAPAGASGSRQASGGGWTP